jgi:integrase
MNARVIKKKGNYYIALEWTEKGERQTRSISVRKRLGLDRPAEAREAKALRDKIMVEYRQGVYVEPSEMLLKEYLAQWLEDYARPNIKQKTYEIYKNMVDNHLIPEIGNTPIGKLRPSQLKGLFAKKLKGGRADGKPGGLSNRSVQYMHMVLKLALKSALEDELVARNVAEAVTPPRVEKPKIKYWEWDDAKEFLKQEKASYEKGHGRYYPVYVLALSTGMRRGELLGLHWKDINYKNKTITIRHSLVQTDDGPLLQDTVKTDNSYRTIEISDKVIEVLKTHRKRQAQEMLALGSPDSYKADLVFTASTGNWVSPSNMDKYFRGAVRRSGLQEIGGMHALRHTYATRMLELGMSPRYVQERLGHANITITLGTYSHVTPKAKSEIAIVTDDLI